MSSKNGVFLDIDMEEQCEEGIEDYYKCSSFDKLTEENIIPKTGYFLGLDISQNSSGICLYANGVRNTYNSKVDYDKNDVFAEARMRKQLKQDLLEVINGNELELIVIEDVFEGANAEVVRKLYALNTAIDDLILDGLVVCKDFVRVQNGVWKSWLSVVDSNKDLKGFNDKEKIQGYLKILGIDESGEGFQDRLDATGMVIGYFLNKANGGTVVVEKKKRVNFKDISVVYEEDIDLVIMGMAYGNEENVNVRYFEGKRISKKLMTDYLTEDPDKLFISKDKVNIGLLAGELGLPIYENGGYVGFWVDGNKKKKYLK